jgi:hypothetical protein
VALSRLARRLTIPPAKSFVSLRGGCGGARSPSLVFDFKIFIGDWQMKDSYIRTVDGKTDTMVQIGPGKFVNTISATRLGLIKGASAAR